MISYSLYFLALETKMEYPFRVLQASLSSLITVQTEMRTYWPDAHRDCYGQVEIPCCRK